MPRKKNASSGNPKRPIEVYEHRNKQRINNPPVGLVLPQTDPDAGQKEKTYAYAPHLDPQLIWAGKAEHTSLEAPTVFLHVHERIALPYRSNFQPFMNRRDGKDGKDEDLTSQLSSTLSS